MPPNRILLLLRHGESTANAGDVFGGWLDFPLTDTGRAQAVAAGRLIREAGLVPQAVHTSLLTRAIDTAEIVAAEATPNRIALQSSWRLNERHYGQLQGRRRADVLAQVGEELFGKWRRSYDVAPPAVGLDDPMHPHNDGRYASLSQQELPAGESLADVRTRLLPYWQHAIAADLSVGRITLVVAHGNSLRALCMHLDDLTPEQVRSLTIPIGVVLRYDLDDALTPVPRGGRYLVRSSGRVAFASAPKYGGDHRSQNECQEDPHQLHGDDQADPCT
jgi:2,3-bisphosphoglycerate-dependent phosphoglycerate mutase